MKLIGGFVATALVFGLAGATPAHANPINLVTNGDFNPPSLIPGSWGSFSSVTGWSGTDGNIEIDTAGAIGPGTDPFTTNSLEVNANDPETVSQTIGGLTVGQTYEFVWEYGGRAGAGGVESMNVQVNGNTVVTDSSGVVSVLTWDTPYSASTSYSFVATGTSVTLDFEGLPPGAGGNGSYGNEVTDVGLYATPEPSTWLLMLSGLGLLGFVIARKRSVLVSLPSATI